MNQDELNEINREIKINDINKNPDIVFLSGVLSFEEEKVIDDNMQWHLSIYSINGYKLIDRDENEACLMKKVSEQKLVMNIFQN